MFDDEYKNCIYCQYHVPDTDTIPADWMCVNADSDRYGEFTDADESCDAFVEKE
jgi:hypothetical protein